ncbi:MAG TPA: M4 family metallopeptidase [Anaeromyxobacter sp.]|nr:M4 family metallopeptidase [Anaeromyxobacter sp.]
MCTPARRARCTILPPHVLKRMAESTAAEVRDAAWETLRLSERLRGTRMATADFLRAVPRGTLHRAIYDAKHTERLPGVLVREERGRRVRDLQVNQAYDGLGATFDFYLEVLSRNSLDDHGMGLDASVHYGRRYMNAFWDGRQMVFGDGDGKIFGPFTAHLDVVAHELTHGVISYEAAFDYQDQAGALNESFADVFGSLVLQRKKGQTAKQASWLVGQGLLVKYPQQALRSLSAPGTAYDNDLLGKDPQPANMKDYRPEDYPDDNGGVHVFSGIPSHAFYLAAMRLGGYAWEKAGRIWYLALTDLLSRRAQFADAALGTATAAGRLFGTAAERMVRDAWEEVGVRPAAARPTARSRRRVA